VKTKKQNNTEKQTNLAQLRQKQNYKTVVQSPPRTSSREMGQAYVYIIIIIIIILKSRTCAAAVRSCAIDDPTVFDVEPS